MILKIRATDDIEDGRLNPIPAQAPGGWLIEKESDDGDRPVLLLVTSVALQEVLPGGCKTLLRASKINGILYITDCRVAFACENYDKGSRHWGIGAGAIVALAADGISKAAAVHRRKGKILVGQTRYPWLRYVAAKPRRGYGSVDEVRLGCDTKTGSETRAYRLDITLANVNPLDAAQDIIRRAARYRLDYFPGKPKDHDRLRELAEAPPLQVTEQKKMSSYIMPNYFFVTTATAHPSPRPDGAKPARVEPT